MQRKHSVLLIAMTLFVFGTAVSVPAGGIASLDETKFYTSHEGHSHLGTIDLDSLRNEELTSSPVAWIAKIISFTTDRRKEFR